MRASWQTVSWRRNVRARKTSHAILQDQMAVGRCRIFHRHRRLSHCSCCDSFALAAGGFCSTPHSTGTSCMGLLYIPVTSGEAGNRSREMDPSRSAPESWLRTISGSFWQNELNQHLRKTTAWPLLKEFRNNLRGFLGAGDKKQMPVIDGDEARTGNERHEDAAVDDRHDRIVRAGHDQGRLL